MRLRSPPITTHQWILFTSSLTILPGLLLHCCQSATVASHLRHRQHGGRDDLDLGVSVTTPDSSPEPPLAPTTPYRMPEVAVRQHQLMRLNCELHVNMTNNRGSGAGVNLVWLRNDEVVSGFDSPLGHRYSVDRTTGQLSVANARLAEDEGVWQCVDRDPQTGLILAASSPVRVIVLDPPRALYLAVDGRRLDPGNLFLPVKEDTELSVVCIVEGGHPEPRVTWLLVLAPGTEERVTLNTTELAHSSSEAHLGRVMRAHHNATVSCLVNHETLATPLNASLLLDVQYSPSFGISRIPGFGFPIREGIAVSLRCDVDSNPPSSPVWVKDDGAPPVPQSGDGFLNFSAIRREHSGWYKCTSRHLLGEFSSIGYFLNVRSDEDAVTAAPGPGESTAVEVSLGGAVQLQCPGGVGGCWSRVGATGSLEPVGPGPQHTIDRVLYQEAGKYHCVLPNRADPFPRHWRESPHVEVSVVGRPVVYLSNKTLSALYGQTLKLAVEYCANPPASRALWLTETKLLAPGEVRGNIIAHNTTTGSSFHCHQAVLIVRDITTKDQGEYVFLVRSPRGLAEGSVLVNVTGVSSFSVSSTRVKHKASTMLFLIIGLLHRFFYKRNYMLFI